jgi:hypothetical protein
VKFRAWIFDEFEDYDEAEREDRAWTVPDRHGILYPENAAPCESPRDAAEQFADHYHGQRDGWESSWPIEVVVHDGDRYWVVVVHREYVPEFSSDAPRVFVKRAEDPVRSP